MSSRSRRPRSSTSASNSSSIEADSNRRSVKVVKVLCDGCEHASASVYCTECKECACQSCAEQLHVRGRRAGRKQASRTCQGRAMKDLQKTVGVLALCTSCRVRPAYRFTNGEVYALCKECRHSHKPPPPTAAHEIVKRAIAAELKQSRQHQVMSKQKSRKSAFSNEDDSTEDDATDLHVSRESSAA